MKLSNTNSSRLKQHTHKDFPARGELIMVDFNPAKGSEIKSSHPALVVSDDRLAEETNFVWVMPISHGDSGPNRLHIPLVDSPIEGNIYTEQLTRIDFTKRLWAHTPHKASPQLLSTAILYAKLILGN